MQLAVECGVGIAVFVRCFTDKTAIEDQIGEKLGYGLSRAPFATIVVSTISFFKKITLVSHNNVVFFLCYIVNSISHVHFIIFGCFIMAILGSL